MKKRMIKLMTIFCMAGILTVNPAIIGLAEEAEAVGADVQEIKEKSNEEPNEEVGAKPEEPEPEKPEPTVDQKITKLVINYNNNDSATSTVTYDNPNLQLGDSIDVNTNYPVENYTRDGYDFIGWYQNGLLVSGGTYIITDEDVKNGTLTFTAGWRQKVTVNSFNADVVTAPDLQENEGATATSVTYTISPEAPSVNDSNYVFAGKWMINDKGPFDTGAAITLTFADENGNCVFNVKADETYGIKKNGDSVLTGSPYLRPTEGSCALIVKRPSDYKEPIYVFKNLEGNDYKKPFWELDLKSPEERGLWNVNDDISFYVPTEPHPQFARTVKSLLDKRSIVYESNEVYPYVEQYVFSLSTSDFVKYVTINYNDEYKNTTFSYAGETASTYTEKSPIYSGKPNTQWISLRNREISAQRIDDDKNEYTLAGWKYQINGRELSKEEENTAYIEFADPEHILTVNPIWEGKYFYNMNYPDSEKPVQSLKPGTGVVGTSVKLPSLEPIRNKYTFAGWMDSHEEKSYQGGATYPISRAAVTFTAQWTPVSHKLSFVDQDGTVYRETWHPYGTTETWSEVREKEGYTLTGWMVKDGKESYGTSGTITIPDHDTVLVAQWRINFYTISYDGNGATMGVPAETVEQNYQTDYTIDTVVPTKTGYTFQGWSDGTTTYQPGAVFKVPARDVVLTAQWKANSHQVKYDGNGGKTSAPESKSADYNSNVSVAAGLEKDGYLFDGWEQISTGKVLTPGASFVMPDMDETLKAKWKIAYTGINGKGTYYLVSGQSYTLGAGLKVQGDNSSYSGNMTFYVPQSGYYTLE